MKESSVNALLFCNDSQLLCAVDRVFTDFGVLTDVCLSLDGVKEALQGDTFDLLAIDLDEPEAAAVIQLWGSREAKLSKVEIAFARQVASQQLVIAAVGFEDGVEHRPDPLMLTLGHRQRGRDRLR